MIVIAWIYNTGCFKTKVVSYKCPKTVTKFQELKHYRFWRILVFRRDSGGNVPICQWDGILPVGLAMGLCFGVYRK